MEKFQSLDHYLNIVDEFKSYHKHLVGNLTTVKRELEGVISEGRLFYSVYPHTFATCWEY